ncbi:polyprenyl synthetase family protein [Actinophytocola algeriensis]|uniref:Geranylgeranyl pyrophosphate synthase n=1 Tax=Actinophytocola algeriensis TaxID=1768010 RepID=A0A7W7QFX5_9PSEU|nr:polyprenyl synthetase family protein [Actinophytocola algeriensis]MBB4912789.1 geranylgeranyl pyrophosphate synthase [Actinophytocola algeriensis]MBE1473543.1 geranylgeranyl pyrophosphate synthase [Actinophytocola algeriensis]
MIDALGLFGTAAATGKPVGEDLMARKAATVLVFAREGADTARRRQLARLDRLPELRQSDVDTYLEIIAATGAREQAERLIERRLRDGRTAFANVALPDGVRQRLSHLADLCGDRDK